ncbi:DUF4124 domain-containing protein [Aromatoleum anaerobium]|uniref:DUF4124 domain-containing protein n=1 Tax=Aromatoleum anaerobium TaxID=182180 RepID=A0ABX1PLS7_9RHOO|nr:DUF4124 domain-containing protein [Aromatoleum anaerobium]MCK0506021.1 hypothetical protein [Aromatoleum anaerobium]
MAFVRRAELLCAVLLALPPAVAAQSERTIYCCEDANGRPVCGDVLPTVCYGRAYREISPQGTVRRHVAAPLTSREIAQRDAEMQRRKDEEARLLKQRRLDQALLDTYTSLEDIDNRQDRAIADIRGEIETARARETELLAERRRLAEEAAAYRGKELPRNIAVAQQSVDGELAAQKSIIDAKIRETEAVQARFAADRRRYAELIAAGEGRR